MMIIVSCLKHPGEILIYFIFFINFIYLHSPAALSFPFLIFPFYLIFSIPHRQTIPRYIIIHRHIICIDNFGIAAVGITAP